jgi:hypothetical protein
VSDVMAVIELPERITYVTSHSPKLRSTSMATCSSCRTPFKNNQGLTKHQHTCKSFQSSVSLLLRKQVDAYDRETASKIARRKGGDVGGERNSESNVVDIGERTLQGLPEQTFEVSVVFLIEYHST